MYVCKVTPIEELVEQIQNNKRIAKASVIQERMFPKSSPRLINIRLHLTVTKKASDPDIEATSQTISLKDPLSYMRLVVPCRGLQCSHIQCFDATAYLQLQEQGPQWICPICNNPAPFQHLAVDEYVPSLILPQSLTLTSDRYVKDILTNTPQSVEQVTIEPDGKWQLPTPRSERKTKPEPDTSFLVDVDDDDLVIGQYSSRQSNTATPSRAAYSYSTPAQGSSREGTSSMPPRSATSNKRPATEVVDLTLSDDDDDAAPPPTKRQNTGSGHSGYNGWSS